MTQKMYYSYSGYKGNLKEKTLAEMMQKKPTDVLWYAIRGMLPKNKLRDARMKRVKIVVGTTTQYDNFKPVSL
jgi:large subunit ribosomal protein L13